jgi:hypothetical protein
MKAFRIFFLALAIGVATPPSAFAMKKRSIVLRATGSGALIGLGAGLVSYPFAKSTGVIFAGAFVGAALGTVYGFHLASERERAYREISLAEPEFRKRGGDPNLLDRPAAPQSVSTVRETNLALPLTLNF